MKHHNKVCVIVVAQIISVLSVLFLCGLIISWTVSTLFSTLENAYLSTIDETHSSDSFLSEEYLKFNGGKSAKKFFDEYAIVNNYRDIQFHYKDGERMISILNYCTAFVLDIYYDDIPEDILELYKNLDVTYYRVPFSIHKIDKNRDVYNDNSAFIMLDRQHKTVRYVFICNYSSISSKGVNESLNNVFFSLNWNLDNEDWIFDYSDIASEDYTRYNKN